MCVSVFFFVVCLFFVFFFYFNDGVLSPMLGWHSEVSMS